MKLNFYILILIFICVSTLVNAEPWKFSADASLAVTQIGYSDNWTGVELGSFTWIAASNSSAEKQINSIMNDKTTLKLAFGQTHSQRRNTYGDKYWSMPEKSTDKVDLESVLKFTLQSYVDPFISGRLETQFLDLADTSMTKTLNPLKFTESGGVSRTLIKQDNQNLNMRLGAALRQKMNRQKLDDVTGDRKTYTTNDGGIDFITEYNKVFVPKNISYVSRLQVFQAIFNSKEKELDNNYWKTADVTWENTLSMKVWSIVTTTLTFKLVYDKELDKKAQYKETLTLGASYKFF